MDNRVTFSFSEADAILAALNFIAEHKRAAFTARVKQLFRHDLLEVSAPGRGRAGRYSITDVLQLVIAVELLQCGMSPPTAAAAVQVNRLRFKQALLRAGSQLERVWLERNESPSTENVYIDNDLYMILTPEALRDLVAEGDRPPPGFITLYPGRLLNGDALRGHDYKEAYWRRVIINVSDVVRAIEDLACRRFRFVDGEDFIQDIMMDADDDHRTVLESLEHPVGRVTDAQVKTTSTIPTVELPYKDHSLPPASVTMSEWAEVGRAISAKHKSAIVRLIKVLKSKKLDNILAQAENLGHLGIFRIDNHNLKITRLGHTVLNTLGYYPGYDYARDDNVDSQA